MKVKVYVKCAPFSKTEQFMQDIIDEGNVELAEAYARNEELFQENKDLRVEVGHLQDEIEQLKSRLAAANADRNSIEASFKRMTSRWEEVTREKREVEEELQSTQVEIADRNERVFILEQRIEMLEQENKEWRNVVEQLSTKVFNQNAEINRATSETYNMTQKNQELEKTVAELRKQLDTKDNSTRNFWDFLVEHNIVKSADEMGGTTNRVK